MVQAIDRRGRGWPLVQRLAVALTAGAALVATVLGFVGGDVRDQHAARVEAARDVALAQSLAERGAPFLVRRDDLRLSMLATVVRDQAQGRALVLDGAGMVVLDTALALGDRQLGLVATSAPLQRLLREAGVADLRETIVAVQHAGAVVGEVRLQRPVTGPAGGFDVAWFGLAFLGCLTLVAGAIAVGHHWSTRLRSATDSLLALAAGHEGRRRPMPSADRELQELGAALRELERGMQDGLHRVGEGYVAMALQVVDGLERRRLAVAGHGERTARLAARLAERLGMAPRDARELDLACRLIDLGKASIRPAILQKSEPLDELEAESLRCHPARGAEQLERVPGLRRVAQIVRHQLERHDGKGTPDGLRGDRIPRGSRILAVCAAFDLLTTCADERPLSWSEALERLQRERAAMFDPELVDLLVDEVQKAPPSTDGREVMLVPTGVLPWRNAGGDVVCDGDADDHEAELELEVLAEPAHGPEQG